MEINIVSPVCENLVVQYTHQFHHLNESLWALGTIGIYVGFQSPSISKYLERLMGDLFTTQFADCIFNGDHFLILERDNKFIKDDRKID
jgi:hypothetical protein